MKATGIVRPVDELGRIVIPKYLRSLLNMDINAPVEILTNGDSIIIKRYEPECAFCKSTNNVIEYRNTNICEECINALKEL